jgi:hypothetical protein
MNLDDIAPFVVPEGPPWLDPNTENQIANSLLTEEETNLKARSTVLVSAPKIDLADGNRREQTYYLKTAANATPSPSPEPSVQIAEHSDVMDPISTKCC